MLIEKYVVAFLGDDSAESGNNMCCRIKKKENYSILETLWFEE